MTNKLVLKQSEPTVSLLVITYLFLGGTGAGALLILIGLDMVSPNASRSVCKEGHESQRCCEGRVGQDGREGRRGRRGSEGCEGRGGRDVRESTKKDYHPQDSYRPFFQPCFIACAATLLFAALCLFFDLGRPDRLLLLFYYPTASYLTLGTYALALATLCSVFLAIIWSSSHARFRLSRWLVRLLEVVGIGASIAVVLYTGLLFYSLGSGTFLDTPLIPVLFVLSALSCGIALIFAAVSIADTTEVFAPTILQLAKLDTILLSLEFLGLAALLLISLINGTMENQLLGSEITILLLALVVAGILIPLILENNQRFPLLKSILTISTTVLMGGFALRMYLLEVGLSTVILGA